MVTGSNGCFRPFILFVRIHALLDEIVKSTDMSKPYLIDSYTHLGSDFSAKEKARLFLNTRRLLYKLYENNSVNPLIQKNKTYVRDWCHNRSSLVLPFGPKGPTEKFVGLGCSGRGDLLPEWRSLDSWVCKIDIG